MGRDYMRAGTEPSLAEALRDPIVQLLMRRDGLEPTEMRRVIDAARRQLLAVAAGAPSPRAGPDDDEAAVAVEYDHLTRPAAGA